MRRDERSKLVFIIDEGFDDDDETVIVDLPPDLPIEGMGTLPNPIPRVGGPVPSVEYLRYIGDIARWKRRSR